MLISRFLDWLLRRRRKTESEPEAALPAPSPSPKPPPVAAVVSEGPADALTEAGDPTTPPERLRELAQENNRLASGSVGSYTAESRRMRVAIAGNPNTPSDLLARLADDALESFLCNPVVPLLVMEEPQFATSLSWTVLRRCVAHPDTPPALLAAITAIPDEQVAGTARRHIALAGEPAPGEGVTAVRECLSGLRSGDTELLRELLDVGIVPAALTPMIEEAIRYAPKDQREWRRPEPRDTETADERARREARDPFTEWPEREGHRIGAARDSRTPSELLQELAEQGSERVRLLVAGNPATPPDVLRKLLPPIPRGLESFRRALAANPATPPDVLQSLASSRGDYIRWLVASHPAVEDRVLQRLVKSRTCSVRRAARHALLARVSQGEEERQAISDNARARALAQAAAEQPGGLARFLAALHPEGKIEQEGAVRSLYWEDRLAAALSAASTTADIEQLANDPARPVRAVARDRLAGQNVWSI